MECRHFEISSLLLFNRFPLSLNKQIKYFSDRHKLQFLLILLYPEVVLIIFQAIVNCLLESFSCQIYLERAVSLLYALLLNDFL